MRVTAAKEAQRKRRAAERNIQRIEAAMIQSIENNITDTDDEQELGDDIDPHVFPTFFMKDISTPHLGKRKNKHGHVKRYKQPVIHPNPSNKKLLPARIPRQTAHNRRKKAKGSNVDMMASWVIRQPQPQLEPEIEPDTVDGDEESDGTIEDTEDEAEDDADQVDDRILAEGDSIDEEYESWINEAVRKYREKEKVAQKTSSTDKELIRVIKWN